MNLQWLPASLLNATRGSFLFLSLQCILACIVIVTLKGMFHQFQDMVFLWRLCKRDFVSTSRFELHQGLKSVFVSNEWLGLREAARLKTVTEGEYLFFWNYISRTAKYFIEFRILSTKQNSFGLYWMVTRTARQTAKRSNQTGWQLQPCHGFTVF